VSGCRVRAILGGMLLGAAACVSGAAPKPAPLNPVRFLLVNDVYVADTMADGSGGLARVATVRQRLADEGPIVFVLAGDVLSPSLLSKYYFGRQMVEAFNAAKLDYATFGNHEFELPLDTLETRIAESKFKWISSNCSRADGTPLAKVLPWDTLRVSGQKVGLFGLTLQGGYRKAYRCNPPDSSAHLAIDQDRTARAARSELSGLRQRLSSLTPRQREVLPLIVSGLLNKQAAAILGIGEVTLQIHRSRIMQKMQAESLPDLVRIAQRLLVPIAYSRRDNPLRVGPRPVQQRPCPSRACLTLQ